MTPQTVGEMRELLKGLPDDMPFSIEGSGLYGSIDDITVGIEKRFGKEIFVIDVEITG